MKIFRQGDVLLKQIRSIPKDATRSEQQDRIVLAYGEATGHVHAIEDLSAVDVFVTASGAMYLAVTKDAALQHEEHSTITLPPGKYERVLQREYAPDAIRNVVD